MDKARTYSFRPSLASNWHSVPLSLQLTQVLSGWFVTHWEVSKAKSWEMEQEEKEKERRREG